MDDDDVDDGDNNNGNDDAPMTMMTKLHYPCLPLLTILLIFQ